MRLCTVRLPDALYGKLKAAAGRERRSVHAEILCLLERGLAAETRQPAVVLTSLESRPGRRVLVITELSDLRGPAGGKVILPERLSPELAGTVFDLDEPSLLREAYQLVLTEAIDGQELATWLNGPRLAEAWPDLYLPDEVRQAWQDVHPDLAARQRAHDAAG